MGELSPFCDTSHSARSLGVNVMRTCLAEADYLLALWSASSLQLMHTQLRHTASQEHSVPMIALRAVLVELCLYTPCSSLQRPGQTGKPSSGELQQPTMLLPQPWQLKQQISALLLTTPVAPCRSLTARTADAAPAATTQADLAMAWTASDQATSRKHTALAVAVVVEAALGKQAHLAAFCKLLGSMRPGKGLFQQDCISHTPMHTQHPE